MPDVAAEILRSAERAQAWDGLGATGRSRVDAAALREACLAADPARHPTGLRIAHAEVVGPLDLTATRVAVGLHFAGCAFTDPPRLDGADLHALAFVGGWTGPGFADRWPLTHPDAAHLPGLLASGVRIRRDL